MRRFLLLILIILAGCNAVNELGVEQYIPPTTNPNQVITSLPYVQLTKNADSLSEATAGNVVATVVMDKVSDVDVVVDFEIEGTAIIDVDFENLTPASRSVVIPAGQLSANISFDVIDDNLHEPIETLIIKLNTPTAGTAALGRISSTSYKIISDEQTPRVMFCDPTDGTFPTNCSTDSVRVFNEGDVGSIRVYLFDGAGLASSGSNLTIPYTISGSATINTMATFPSVPDYSLSTSTSGTSGSFTIPAGATSFDIFYTINNAGTGSDGISEPTEQFYITLGNGSGYLLGSPSVFTGNIVSVDPEVVVSIDPANSTVSIAENGGSASVRVGYIGTTDKAIRVPYSVTGTATTGVDHQLAAGTVTIPAGINGFSDLNIVLKDDSIYEGNETIQISLGVPDIATLDVINTTHTITIIENEPPPEFTLSVASQTTFEPTTSGILVKVTAMVSNGVIPYVPVKVPIKIDTGTEFTSLGKIAQTNVDHELQPTSDINISPGQTSGFIQFRISHDDIDEYDEKIRILMQPVTNANACSSTDSAANLTANNPLIAPNKYGIEHDTGRIKFNNTLADVNWNTLPYVTLAYEESLVDTTPAAATYYVVDKGYFRIADGVTAWGSLPPTISSSCHLNQVVNIIDNDDAPNVSFELASQIVAEAPGATATIRVRLDKRSGKDVRVVFGSIKGDNATFLDANPALTDFTLPVGWTFSGTLPANNVSPVKFPAPLPHDNDYELIIPANNTQAQVVFGINNDSIVENNHSFTLDMSTAETENAFTKAPLTHTVNITDSQTLPLVTFKNQTANYTEGSGTTLYGVTPFVDNGTTNECVGAAAQTTEPACTAAGGTWIANTPTDHRITLCLSQEYAYPVIVPIEIDSSITTAKLGAEYDYTLPLTWTEEDPTTWKVTIPANVKDDGTGCHAYSFALPMVDDVFYENNETIKIKMGQPTNALRADQDNNPANDSLMYHEVTLISNEAAPVINFQTVSQTISENNGKIRVTAQLTGTTKADADITVPVKIEGITTTTYGVTEDYTLPLGFTIPDPLSPLNPNDTWVIKIPAGEISGSIEFPLRDDTDYENITEMFVLGWNHNDESGSGLQIKYNNIDDTNILVYGLCSAGGHLTRAACEGASETWTPQLHTANIQENDGVPEIKFELLNQTLSEASGVAEIRVLLSGRSFQPINLMMQVSGTSSAQASFCSNSLYLTETSCNTNGGTWTSADYDGLFEDINLTIPLSTPYTIPVGTSEFKLYAKINDDTQAEIKESLIVDLVTVSPLEAFIDPVLSRHILYITDNENLPIVGFNPANSLISVTEGVHPNFTITVQLETPNTSSAPIKVPLSFTGSAKMSSSNQTFDYTVPGTWDVNSQSTWFIEIPPGMTSASQVFTLEDDNSHEPSENIVILMGTPENAQAGANTIANVVITSDDGMPTVSFGTLTQDVVEQNVTINIPVTVSEPSGYSLSVGYVIDTAGPLDIDAISGTDYNLVSGRITIPAGASSVNLPVSIIDDVNFESDEYIKVVLSDPGTSPYIKAINPNDTHTIKIKDNDLPPRVSFDSNFSEVTEPNSGTRNLQLRVVLDNPSFKNVWVPVTIGNIAGTAQASSCSDLQYTTEAACNGASQIWTKRDFIFPSTWVMNNQNTVAFSIPAGQTEAVVTLQIESDSIFEVDETITMTLGAAVGLCTGEIPVGTGYTPDLCASAATPGTWDLAETTAIMGVNPIHTVYITDGGIKPRISFTAPSQIINEGNGVYACFGAAGATQPICEGNGGIWKQNNNIATITVNSNVTSVHDIKIPIVSILGYGDDPAKTPDDFDFPGGWSTGSNYNHIITIPAGMTTASITMTIKNDMLVEKTEAFQLTMGTPYIQNATDNYVRKGDITNHVVYINTDITDEIPDVYFASSKTFAMESSGSATPLLILDAPSAYDVEVSFRVNADACSEIVDMPPAGAGLEDIVVQRPCTGSNANPTIYAAENNGKDFEFYDGTVTIPAGETIVAFPAIPIINDYDFERDEQFTIEIVSVTNAEFGFNADTLTKQQNYRTEVIIVNDDALPALSFDLAYDVDIVDPSISRQQVLETPGPGTQVKVKVVSNGTHFQNMEVAFSILGTATPAAGGCPAITQTNDFAFPFHEDCSGSSWVNDANKKVIIPAGETSAEFTFMIYDDFLYEMDETIIISMLAPSNAFIGPRDTHIITIMDSDPLPTPSFTTINQVVYEPKLCTTELNNFNYNTYLWDGGTSPNTYEGATINCGTISNRNQIDGIYTGIKSLPVEVKIYVVPETTMIIPINRLDVKDGNTVISGDFFLPTGWSDLVNPLDPNVLMDPNDPTSSPTNLNWYVEIDPEALPICGGSVITDCCSYKPSSPGAEYGECRKTVYFTLIDDDIYESDDEFTLTMGTPFLYNPPYQSVVLSRGEIYQTTVTILNDTTGIATKDRRGPLHIGGGNFININVANDPPPTVKFLSSTGLVEEITDPISLNCAFGRQYELDIKLSNYSAFETIIPININQFEEFSIDPAKSTAKPNVDHDFVPVLKTLAPGMLEDYETFCVKNDNDTEGQERIVLEIGNPINGKKSTVLSEYRHTLTINHNDPAKIIAGQNHTCAIISEKLRCWGSNSYGQTGYPTDQYGSTVTGIQAFDFVNLGSGSYVIEKVGIGQSHTCALMMFPDEGNIKRMKCWGSNNYGQTGNGIIQAGTVIGDNASEMGDSLPYVFFGSNSITVKDMAVGANHTCAILSNNNIHCWGLNWYGQLGLNHNINIGDDQPEIYANGPVQANFLADSIYAGDNHTCILGGGLVQCWGDDQFGQASGGKSYCNNEHDNGLDTVYGTFDDIPAGYYLNTSSFGTQNCTKIGDESSEVGNPSYAAQVSDYFATSHGYPALEVITNSSTKSTCFKHELGTYTCIGKNSSTELGRPHNRSIGGYNNTNACIGGSNPGAGDSATCIAAGGEWKPRSWYDSEYRNNYVNSNPLINSFDDNVADDLFINFLKSNDSDIQLDPSLYSPVKFQVGNSFSCALLENKRIVCRGANSSGQRGIDSIVSNSIIQTQGYRDVISSINYVGDYTDIQDISIGHSYGCMVRNSNEIICWGENSDGQAGLGNTTDICTNTNSCINGNNNAIVVKPGKGYPIYKDY